MSLFSLINLSINFGIDVREQAETKKLLDIVARSLYTDKEIFIREVCFLRF